MEIKKIIATASTLALIAGAAFAQDFSGLLNQILSYLQQNPQVVQQVQQAVGQVSTPSACQGVTFTRTLRFGMSGSDVRCLQALLNVSPQSGYFGSLTRAAVIKFQEDNAEEILAPLGLTRGTGVVGPSTRAKLNAMLSGGAAPQVQLPTAEQAKSLWDLFVEQLKQALGISGVTTPAAGGVEGTLTAELQAVPSNVTVHEGDKNVAVMAFKVKAKNSPITVDRVDLVFNAGGNIVYKYLNYAALYEGDNAIKGSDLNSSTMEKSGSDYTLRLSGLNLKVDKDSEKVLTVKVSAVSVYPSSFPSSLTVKILANGIRGTDSAGIQQYAPSSDFDAKTINLALMEQGSIEVSLSNSTPKEGVQIVSADDDTEITLAAYDVKAKKQNLRLTTVNVTLSSTASTTAVRLYDGSTLVQEKTPSTTVTFDGDMEIDMAKDSTKTLYIKVVIAKGRNNATYSATLASISGADANENAITGGSSLNIDGYTQYVYTKAPEVALVSQSAVASNGNATTGDELGTFKITFSAKAKGGNIWVSASTTDLGVEIVSSSGTTTANSITLNVTGATEESWGWKVAEGQTATFDVTIVYSNAGKTASQYLAKITKLVWNTSNSATGTQEFTGNLVKDLKTGYVWLASD
jgi:peptidoglycan hydrolase-like protein with peptidoglycan-binding domain